MVLVSDVWLFFDVGDVPDGGGLSYLTCLRLWWMSLSFEMSLAMEYVFDNGNCLRQHEYL